MGDGNAAFVKDVLVVLDWFCVDVIDVEAGNGGEGIFVGGIDYRGRDKVGGTTVEGVVLLFGEGVERGSASSGFRVRRREALDWADWKGGSRGEGRSFFKSRE